MFATDFLSSLVFKPKSVAKFNAINFNSTYTSIIATHSTGFKVYDLTGQIRYQRNFQSEPIQDANSGVDLNLVELLDETTIVGLVGGGSNPRGLSTALTLFDYQTQTNIMDLNAFNPILAVRLSRQLVVYTTKQNIYIYGYVGQISNLVYRHHCDTLTNELGVVSVASKANVIACQGYLPGEVQVIRFNQHQDRTTVRIEAHSSSIQCLALNADGTYLATASINGNTIRIFHTLTLMNVYELHRGLSSAKITSINFNSDSTRILVASDRGTVHVFILSESEMCSKYKIYPSFNPDQACFSADNNVVIVSKTGQIRQYQSPSYLNFTEDQLN
jgi:hypothetical protein